MEDGVAVDAQESVRYLSSCTFGGSHGGFINAVDIGFLGDHDRIPTCLGSTVTGPGRRLEPTPHQVSDPMCGCLKFLLIGVKPSLHGGGAASAANLHWQ